MTHHFKPGVQHLCLLGVPTCSLTLVPLLASVHTGLVQVSCGAIIYMGIPILGQEIHFKSFPFKGFDLFDL